MFAPKTCFATAAPPYYVLPRHRPLCALVAHWKAPTLLLGSSGNTRKRTSNEHNNRSAGIERTSRKCSRASHFKAIARATTATKAVGKQSEAARRHGEWSDLMRLEATQMLQSPRSKNHNREHWGHRLETFDVDLAHSLRNTTMWSQLTSTHLVSFAMN